MKDKHMVAQGIFIIFCCYLSEIAAGDKSVSFLVKNPKSLSHLFLILINLETFDIFDMELPPLLRYQNPWIPWKKDFKLIPLFPKPFPIIGTHMVWSSSSSLTWSSPSSPPPSSSSSSPTWSSARQTHWNWCHRCRPESICQRSHISHISYIYGHQNLEYQSDTLNSNSTQN